ncbi:hypothetical protein N7447_001743 [Penicillium robsamsonii]|uniref:uncharacterized protein n=1 Tax=Penicillium robsamsonii TaxID=1792511 RepID=UPI0025488B0E|nr:uncharacterized protein N7447_001743 [Penicillium robsamsonii]KAJ5835717.1 hypothetical protein N7447_001743 [Penicillium robsamsonii]
MVDTTVSPQNPRARNVLMKLEDDSSLKEIEDQDSQNPSTPITRTDMAVAPVYKAIVVLGFIGILTWLCITRRKRAPNTHPALVG